MPKKNKRGTSVQELLNIEDVREGFLLTKDQRAIGFLRVQPISVSLMTETEKEQLTRRIRVCPKDCVNLQKGVE